MEHPKDVGDRSTLAIMSALQECGYALYLPFGENTRCDLIVERQSNLIRIQCKTGRLREGAIRFAVCSCYGHHRNPETARRSYQGQVDFFAVYCPETRSVYLIPIEDVPLKVAAYLRVHPPRNNQRRRIRMAADYEIARVTTEGLRASSGA
jgi:PD-(D/E)XK nuclease superfamily protein